MVSEVSCFAHFVLMMLLPVIALLCLVSFCTPQPVMPNQGDDVVRCTCSVTTSTAFAVLSCPIKAYAC